MDLVFPLVFCYTIDKETLIKAKEYPEEYSAREVI